MSLGGIVMTTKVDALDQYVEKHLQQSMLELARLCHQPSVSAQGLGMRECAELVAQMLLTRGFTAQALCKIDFRLVPDQDPEDVVRKLRAHLEVQGFDDIEIMAEPGERPGVVDPDDPLIQLDLDTARAVYNKEPVLNPLCGGSGPYAPFLEYLQTPIISVGVGYPGSLGHAPNEHIRMSDWLLGTRHMARIFDVFG